VAAVATIALASFQTATSKGFLVDNSGEDVEALRKDLQTAMEEVLGCGGQRVKPERLADIERVITPMWRTMPSATNNGRLDWRSLRYVAHRYFMQTSSLLIKGLEPSRLLGDSDTGAAEILSKSVPEHVDIMLGGHHVEKAIRLMRRSLFWLHWNSSFLTRRPTCLRKSTSNRKSKFRQQLENLKSRTCLRRIWCTG